MLIDRNPWIREVEFASKGEVFLNSDLPQILEYAQRKSVSTDMNHGVNLNDASEEALEALVKYQAARLRVSIDGITQETYRIYRVGGNLKQVIDNIRRINSYKEKYQSSRPTLILQFIPFGHNEHEMDGVRLLARLLNMEMSFFLNRAPDVFPVQDGERIKRHVGYADRRDYLARKGENYVRFKCYEMWTKPHIGWDGKLFGCTRNIWGVYADNVFEEDLLAWLRSEKMQYTRDMLMGKVPPRRDIPCTKCSIGRDLVESGNWLRESEIYGGTGNGAE